MARRSSALDARADACSHRSAKSGGVESEREHADSAANDRATGKATDILNLLG
jgi:hypothetical protein